MVNTAYLALGSNLGDRVGNLRNAVLRLESAGRLIAVSSLYETEPVDLKEQPWFLNAVVSLETALAPRQLLALVGAVESELGRQREIPKGPRTLDVDILLFGTSVVNEPDLRIPHAGMHRRRFVLEPLAEIAPDICHPLLSKSVRQLLLELDDRSVVRRLDQRIEI